jgi:Domain of unknown function (DUF4158)
MLRHLLKYKSCQTNLFSLPFLPGNVAHLFMSVVTILSAKEKKAFESPPLLTSKERKRYFAFPRAALQAAERLRTPTTKVCFLTAYGYFRYANKFFNRQLHDKDITFVARKLGFPLEAVNLDAYQKDVYQDHKTWITSEQDE